MAVRSKEHDSEHEDAFSVCVCSSSVVNLNASVYRHIYTVRMCLLAKTSKNLFKSISNLCSVCVEQRPLVESLSKVIATHFCD